MRLYDENFKDSNGEILPLARCLVIPNGNGYFEGVKAMGDFSPERVDLYFKTCAVCVEGQGLSVKKYLDGDLFLSGKITALNLLQKEDGGAKR